MTEAVRRFEQDQRMERMTRQCGNGDGESDKIGEKAEKCK